MQRIGKTELNEIEIGDRFLYDKKDAILVIMYMFKTEFKTEYKLEEN